jgi:RNA polymerase sigma factor (sigma-70 family)
MKVEFAETSESAFESFDALQSKELLGLLEKAMSRLDERIKLMLEDHLIHNLTYREIAEKHSMPIGSVGVSLSRGLKKVREHIDDEPKLKEHLQHYLERLKSEA